MVKRLQVSAWAALVHLAISGLIATLAALLIFGVWYPGALASLQGVDRLVLILIGVDVVIGPLITLIVFDPAKKSLKFDLGVVALMQTAALVYGLHAIYGGRPAYVVFNVARFNVVAAQEISQESLSKANSDVQISRLGPLLVAARFPEDPAKKSEILFSSLSGGYDLPQLPEYFVPLDVEKDAMRARMKPIAELRAVNALSEVDWTSFLEGYGKPEEDLRYLPIIGNERDGSMILDAGTAEILGLTKLLPK